MSHFFKETYGKDLDSAGCLNLEGTAAIDSDLAHCAEVPGLKTLYVSRKITETGIAHLSSAAELEELYLGDSMLVTKDRARQILGKSHPNLKYYY